MASTALLSLGSLFLFGFFQEDGEIRAIKVAEAAFNAICHAGRTGQTIAFLIHLVGKVIDFLGAMGDAESTALAEFFNDGGGHSGKSPFPSLQPVEQELYTEYSYRNSTSPVFTGSREKERRLPRILSGIYNRRQLEHRLGQVRVLGEI
jgi:hypothetical protein